MESIVSDQPVQTVQADLKQHFTQMSESPFLHVACQISKLYAFQCQRGRILEMGFFLLIFQLVTPGAGPVLTPGAHEQTW